MDAAEEEGKVRAAPEALPVLVALLVLVLTKGSQILHKKVDLLLERTFLVRSKVLIIVD